MDATQLRYFSMVCQEGSYARAAEKLFISPQGLSKAIHKLESELDVTLFESTGSGLSLTSYGILLLQHAASYLQSHQQILNELDVMKHNADRELTIGVKAGFAEGLGEDFMMNFILSNPEIHVQLRSFPMPALHEAMKKPERSVWILPGPYDPTRYESIYEHSERLFLIVGESHQLAGRSSVSVHEIAQYPRIELAHDIGQKLPMEQALLGQSCREADYLVDIADDRLTMKLVQSGQAISLNSGWHYKQYPGIHRIDFSDLNVVIKANVLIRRDAAPTTALACFRNYVGAWRREHPETVV